VLTGPGLQVLSAKSIAVRLLARREHSTLEIRNKLRQRDLDIDEIEQAIAELEQGGWLSDERFAEAYIRMRRQKGYGPIRIAMELNERGVSQALIEALLDADSDNWLQSVKQQYLKKYGGKPVRDYSDKAKRMRFLQYRGFATEMIHQVVDDKYIINK
jgi:regulatory protein